MARRKSRTSRVSRVQKRSRTSKVSRRGKRVRTSRVQKRSKVSRRGKRAITSGGTSVVQMINEETKTWKKAFWTELLEHTKGRVVDTDYFKEAAEIFVTYVNRRNTKTRKDRPKVSYEDAVNFIKFRGEDPRRIPEMHIHKADWNNL